MQNATVLLSLIDIFSLCLYNEYTVISDVVSSPMSFQVRCHFERSREIYNSHNKEHSMIEFKTQLDVNSQNAFNKMLMKKLIILFLVASLIIIGIGIFGLVVKEDGEDGASAIILIIIGVFITPLMILLNAIGQRSVKKTSPFLQNPTKEIYRFTEEGIEHLQKRGESFQSHTKADYTYFYKIISTPKYYFAFIASNQCHVIDKSHITQGTCEDLDAILAKKLPVGKFKKKN